MRLCNFVIYFVCSTFVFLFHFRKCKIIGGIIVSKAIYVQNRY